MASLFIASAMGSPLSVAEQISLLLFMMIASKGAAGVTGAGLATLAGGLQAHRPDLVDGVGLIVGIDRFMSEARALTNFSGNAVATLLIGKWVGEFDRDRAKLVLDGGDPFDEATMIDDTEAPTAGRALVAGHERPAERAAEPTPVGAARYSHEPRGGGPSGGGPPPRPPFRAPDTRPEDIDDGEPADAPGKLRTGPDRRRCYTARISARGESPCWRRR